MPADSRTMKPTTAAIRPRWARIVAGFLLVLVIAGAGILISAMVRAGTEQPHYTMAIVMVSLAAVVFLVMQLSVVAKPRAEGLYVRNLVYRHHLQWAEIISVRFSPDRPWAQLDLAVGEPLHVMAIQSADGASSEERRRGQQWWWR